MRRTSALDNFATGIIAASIIMALHLVVGVVVIFAVILIAEHVPLIPIIMSSWR